MLQNLRRVPELSGCRPDDLPLDNLLAAGEPRVLKGLVADWALTRIGLKSEQEAMAYLRSFYNGKPLRARSQSTRATAASSTTTISPGSISRPGGRSSMRSSTKSTPTSTTSCPDDLHRLDAHRFLPARISQGK